MCCTRPYTIPELLHRSVRRRRQQAESGGLSRARLADVGVRHRIGRRRDRAQLKIDPIDLRLKNAVAEGDTAPYGPQYGPIGLRQVLEAVRRPSALDGAARQRTRDAAWRCGFWFNAGMNSSATVSAERRRQRGGRDRQSRHRRHARRAGDDGVRGARHSGRAGAAESWATPTAPATAT